MRHRLALATVALAACTADAPLEAWQAARVDHARFLALAETGGAYARDLEHKYPRLWHARGGPARLPESPDVDGLEAALRAHAERHGLTVTRFAATPVPAPDRAPPTGPLDPDTPAPWRPDDVRRALTVTTVLTPADLGLLEAFFETRLRIPRLVRFESITVRSEGAEAVLTAWHLVPDPPLPDRRMPPRTAPDGSGPRAKEIHRLHAELEQRRDEVDFALAMRTRAELWDARFRFLDHVLSECSGQRWVDVVR